MKKIAAVILAIIGIIASTLVVQFGWNKIMITIIDVNKISFWQAFGLNVLFTYILPKEKLKKEDYEEEFLNTVYRGLVSTIIYAGLLLLASLFV
ncbi:Uncharacterised protein [Streptococcus gordonii]|uniref:hypothetical protein n=1 Tax=Streptococcus gordonii TaxID=1302 RepID=UPI000779060A|nr:hypothetical protein [Streptococcus gordonii]VTT05525.1 Uncharacterised protein [Streptococcus gordonii]